MNVVESKYFAKSYVSKRATKNRLKDAKLKQHQLQLKYTRQVSGEDHLLFREKGR
jgi:hypothetical protein